MIYTFPKCRFVDISSEEQQFDHIKSEYMEAVKARGAGERDEELMDLWHSIESYFRIREAKGIDVQLTITQTIDKNKLREYYTKDAYEDWGRINLVKRLAVNMHKD
jgi:hypothetical protein